MLGTKAKFRSNIHMSAFSCRDDHHTYSSIYATSFSIDQPENISP